MPIKGPDPRERETVRESVTFGDIKNVQTELTVSYKDYNIRTGRCKSCKLGTLMEEKGDCGAENSSTFECYQRL